MRAAADHLSAAAFARRAPIAVAVVALALLLWRAAEVLLLALGAVMVAVLLRACAGPVARRTPHGERWALAAATLAVLLVPVLAGWLVGAEVRAQVADLLNRLPAA